MDRIWLTKLISVFKYEELNLLTRSNHYYATKWIAKTIIVEITDNSYRIIIAKSTDYSRVDPGNMKSAFY